MISTEAERHLIKFNTCFGLRGKAYSKLRIERKFFNLFKDIYKKICGQHFT